MNEMGEGVGDALTPAMKISIADQVNFAGHQNAVPFLRALSVENRSLIPLRNLTLDLEASPEFITAKRWTFDEVAANGEVRVKDRKVDLNGQFLMGLAEALAGEATFTLRSGERILAKETRAVRVLARNEWGGCGSTPELLAAFSQPNDPAVDKILAKAAKVLEAAAPNAKLDGYVSGSRKRVWAMAAAIWSAVASYKLKYTLPPASFEAVGQKIRSPSMIVEGGVATCLDTTMLFCSALEQAGLRPIVLMMKEHALVGVWLQPEQFSSAITEDVSAIRKRIALDEILVFETTLVTVAPVPLFNVAVTQGKNRLAPEDVEFILALDIHRARGQKIGPLSFIAKQSLPTDVDGTMGAAPIETPPDLPDFDIKPDVPDLGTLSPRDRLDAWQRRLLDLTARNPLLNHRAGASSLQLICHDPAALEELIAAGEQVKIKPLPIGDGARDAEMYLQETGYELQAQTAAAGLLARELYAKVPKDKLDSVLIDIYRKSRSDLEEGGANTLFIAIGFMIWKRDDSDRKFRAPLLLIPVELKRASARTPPVLSAHDDESRFNPTLLQMLRQDFALNISGLDRELPRVGSGIHVHQILNRVRESVKNVEGFDVVDDVVLGTFSFAKYLMWKDLVDRTEQLRRNAVVAHLLDKPREKYPSGGSFPAPNTLDYLKSPRDIFAPLDYDSSQLSAIVASADGRDFVLIGPPGTGKSQSIANIICQNLAVGKKILFVAEKRAALDVVYRRIDQLGLAPFCLELHSNKAKKREVLNQLNRAWQIGSGQQQDSWELEADRLKAVRDRLNQYVAALHKMHRNGLSVHSAIGVRVSYGQIPRIEFSFATTDAHDKAALDSMREAIHRMDVQAATIGSISDHPLKGIKRGDWSHSWQTGLLAAGRNVIAAAANARATLGPALSVLGLLGERMDRGKLRAVCDICAALLAGAKYELGWCLSMDAPSLIKYLQIGCETLDVYNGIEKGLSVPYAPEPWRNLDLSALRRQWQEGTTSWWPKSLLRRRKVVRALQTVGGTNGRPSAGLDLSLLAKMEQEGRKIDEIGSHLAAVKSWKGFATPQQGAAETIGAARKIRQAIATLGGKPEVADTFKGKISEVLAVGEELLVESSALSECFKRFEAAYHDLEAKIATFESEIGGSIDESVAVGVEFLDYVSAEASRVTENELSINRWCAWLRARDQAMAFGLEALIREIEDGTIPVGKFNETFEAAYCGWWVARKIDEEEALRLFSAGEHDDQVKLFRELDEKVQELTAEYVKARICANIPSKDDIKDKPHFGILNREIQKQARNLAVRELFTQARDIIPILAPCVLMSPLSVAQYLPADLKAFDLVIFDEASQIAVWDAIGAVARGHQVIVAGDPKQMPPTNFFARAYNAAADDSDVEEDLDSILDEMLAATIPSLPLLWHYRSKSEGLIAFSNSKYYEGSLITFPAPNTDDRSVKLNYVSNGVYLRGKDQTNHREAQAIVDHVVMLLRQPGNNATGYSIGIVSFNAKQQNLIENMLDQARKQYPEIEPHFSDERREPVFVKNLESVQGDERDIILFSVTFGRDEAGALTMNFGPLNQEGGWRRLNVAITRARVEMIVFSSIKAEHIDLSKTGAAGVEGLKEFLDYAERGVTALGTGPSRPRGDYDSPFESAVANALRQRGWVVHTQVGVGPFRIDLAIVHPDKPGRYLAAVECDGATYHRSATARDRDKVREGVLRNLGWDVLRIWSTDYWINSTLTLDRIDQTLRDLRAAETTSPVTVDDGPHSQPALVAELENDENSLRAKHSDDPDLFGETETENRNANHRREPLVARAVVLAPKVGTYRTATLADLGVTPQPDLFYESSYSEALKYIVRRIVEMEGPIHIDALVTRVARLHGFQRAGNLIFDRVMKACRAVAAISKEEVGTFVWSRDTDPGVFDLARIPATEMDRRSPEHICAQELIAFLRMHLEQDDPPLAVARALGIQRLAAGGRERLEQVLKFVRAQGNS